MALQPNHADDEMPEAIRIPVHQEVQRVRALAVRLARRDFRRLTQQL